MGSNWQNWNVAQRIECLLDGEVMEVFEDSKGTVFYNVMTLMPNGSRYLLTRVPMATIFGGIGDNFQARLRGTNDDEEFEPTESDSEFVTTIGDRVIVGFLGGHIQRPIIVGFLPHPKETNQFESPSSIKPQGKLNYLGMEFFFDETGQFKIVHRGAPKVKKIGGGLLGAAAGALGALGSLGSLSVNAAKANPALEYPSTDSITMMEWLDDGVWTVRDAKGQQILMDHNKSEIRITNSGKSTSTDSDEFRGLDGKGEYVLLNFDDGLLQLHARDMFEVLSEDKIHISAKGDRAEEILGNDTLTVSGDKEAKIVGNLTWNIGGDYKSQLGGAMEWTIGGDQKLTLAGKQESTVTGDITLTALAKVTQQITGDLSTTVVGKVSETFSSDYSQSIVGKYESSALGGVTIKELISSIELKGGKIAIKGLSGELLDIIGKIVDAITKISVPTAVGPSGPPINTPEFVALKLLIDTMKG